FWQKQIIREAARLRVPVITATQMLESMITSPRPTRAEVSDVANAIFDGTDAVMLSGETAVGQYPLEAVYMMARVALETETHLAAAPPLPTHRPASNTTEAISGAAWHLAEQNPEVTAIACFTRTGYTARILAKSRPRVPVLGFTADDAVERRLALLWGVVPSRMVQEGGLDALLQHIEAISLQEGHVRRGDLLVVVGNLAGLPGAAPDFLKLHRVGG
ncbi:MAG: pyruvate kinase, partial [Chloroflexi bacterium]|nr:pyruvate kinase [Chloroflexota bacterium]